MLALVLIIAFATVAYPFVIYTQLNTWGPAVLAWGLFALLLARVLLRGEFKKPEQYLQLCLVGGLCVIAAVLQSEELLRYYPVAMSLAFAGFFLWSLRTATPLIERFAAFRNNEEFAPHARYYMRQLTKIWAVLLAVNGVVATYTACCVTLESWTLYNGAISYIVLGVFTLIELVVRHFYKKKHEG